MENGKIEIRSDPHQKQKEKQKLKPDMEAVIPTLFSVISGSWTILGKRLLRKKYGLFLFC